MLKCHQILFPKLFVISTLIQQFRFLYSFLYIFATKVNTNVCTRQRFFFLQEHAWLVQLIGFQEQLTILKWCSEAGAFSIHLILGSFRGPEMSHPWRFGLGALNCCFVARLCIVVWLQRNFTLTSGSKKDFLHLLFV